MSMPPLDRKALAAGLEAAGADAWLIFDFHGLNPVAARVREGQA